MKDNQFNPEKIEGEEGTMKQEIAVMDEEAIKKQEIAWMEKKAAKKKKEMAKLEKKKARVEMKIFKNENGFNKSRIDLEKLQLDWIKWNITCIALGFTAYQFYYERVNDEHNPVNYQITGKDIGIFLISLGFITLLFATIEHKKNIQNLKLQIRQMSYSLTLWLSYFILGLSIVVLAMIILRS